LPPLGGAWRCGVTRQAIDPETVSLNAAWHLAMRMSR